MHRNNICRVCGLKFKDYYPWGENSDSPSFDICPCCGTEFGYQDCIIEAIKAQRERWKNSGYNWKYEKEKPLNWLLEEQLAQIPAEYK